MWINIWTINHILTINGLCYRDVTRSSRRLKLLTTRLFVLHFVQFVHAKKSNQIPIRLSWRNLPLMRITRSFREVDMVCFGWVSDGHVLVVNPLVVEWFDRSSPVLYTPKQPTKSETMWVAGCPYPLPLCTSSFWTPSGHWPEYFLKVWVS